MTTSQRPILLCVDDEVRSLETLERTLDEEFDVQSDYTGFCNRAWVLCVQGPEMGF